MNRNSKLVDARRKYIKKIVSGSRRGITKTVENLSQRLFISPRTIYADLAKAGSEKKKK